MARKASGLARRAFMESTASLRMSGRKSRRSASEKPFEYDTRNCFSRVLFPLSGAPRRSTRITCAASSRSMVRRRSRVWFRFDSAEARDWHAPIAAAAAAAAAEDWDWGDWGASASRRRRERGRTTAHRECRTTMA
jgi:hypothetical protein